jgi:hypothetical protein
MSVTNRRQFLSDNFSAGTAFAEGAALGSLGARVSRGDSAARTTALTEGIDETTGLPLLRLPEGFRYRSFGWTGEWLFINIQTPGITFAITGPWEETLA